jgi:toxic protein SymE
MAENNSIAEVKISKTLRWLKVGYTSIRHESRTDVTTTWYSRCPCINLKGNWLEEASFTIATPVILAVEHGQPVI